MATTNYLLTQTQNSSGESQIILRTYVRHDHPIRDMGQPQTLGQEERHHDTDYSRRGTGNAVAEKRVTKTPDCLY